MKLYYLAASTEGYTPSFTTGKAIATMSAKLSFTKDSSTVVVPGKVFSNGSSIIYVGFAPFLGPNDLILTNVIVSVFYSDGSLQNLDLGTEGYTLGTEDFPIVDVSTLAKETSVQSAITAAERAQTAAGEANTSASAAAQKASTAVTAIGAVSEKVDTVQSTINGTIV